MMRSTSRRRSGRLARPTTIGNLAGRGREHQGDDAVAPVQERTAGAADDNFSHDRRPPHGGRLVASLRASWPQIGHCHCGGGPGALCAPSSSRGSGGEAVSASITIRTGPSLIVSRADCPRGFVEIEAMCDGLRAACCSVLPALAARFSPEAFRLEAETQTLLFKLASGRSGIRARLRTARIRLRPRSWFQWWRGR